MNLFYTFFKTGFSIAFLLTLIYNPSVAQQQKPQKVQFSYDSSAVPELFHQIPVGFIFTFPNRASLSTRGFLHGKLRWKDLRVQSPQGVIKKGILQFDPEKVWHNHHRIDFCITYADTTFRCGFILPYLLKIRFNLYTDSIKRGVPFYLNVEGVFSNGKVYPLDTMKLHFYSSKGELTNNVLHLAKTDSTTTHIRVKSVFKWDTAIMDTAVIPVKMHIEDVNLPTENELFRQWGHKKKRN